MSGLFHIIDDQPFIHEFVAAVLEDIGYKSFTFSSPEEYLDHLGMPTFKKPLAVITDISMPGMSGYEMIERISEQIPDMRFIIMTGNPSYPPNHKWTGCMYLAKPFSSKGLTEVVSKVLLCESTAPSCRHGCGDTGDRNIFDLPDWQCPLESKKGPK